MSQVCVYLFIHFINLAHTIKHFFGNIATGSSCAAVLIFLMIYLSPWLTCLHFTPLKVRLTEELVVHQQANNECHDELSDLFQHRNKQQLLVKVKVERVLEPVCRSQPLKSHTDCARLENVWVEIYSKCDHSLTCCLTSDSNWIFFQSLPFHATQRLVPASAN